MSLRLPLCSLLLPLLLLVHFRQGVGSYRDAVDITISSQSLRDHPGVGLTDRTGGTLSCYRVAGDNGYETRALLRFDNLRLPPGSRVTSATLTLTFINWSADLIFRSAYLRRPFDARSARLGWGERQSGAPWGAPGAQKAGDDILSEPTLRVSGFRGDGSEVRTLTLDPQIVNEWARDPARNFGLVLWSESPPGGTRIASSEDPDPARRPLLTINYDGAAMADPSPLPRESAPPPPAATTTTSAAAASAPPQRATPHLQSGPPPALKGPLAAPQLATSAGRPRLILDAAQLDRLWRRAGANDPAWLRLRERCDEYLHGTVEWSDGVDYVAHGGIGEGYQGSDYFEALMNIGLCYQVARHGDAARARLFGKKGADLLFKMSETEAPHGAEVTRSLGYGIRFYGVGMAFGYDWLYDALDDALRARLRKAVTRWLTSFAQKGFGHDHPQGNYFAGYYATKGLAGLAMRGDDPAFTAQWQEWLTALHRGFVQPYYAAHLAGGGWPEGWNYGPLASMNMSLPLWAARTALGLDLSTGPASFRYPLEEGAHLMHFTWPSRRTLDDRQTQYPGDNPSSANPALFSFEAALLRYFGDPLAPQFQRYAHAVRDAVVGENPALWQDLLYWDGAAPEADFTSLPRSFLATGMGQAAMRSGWDEAAVWASFSAGPYINYDGSGEQYYDQGGLAIVRGGRPFLVNAVAAINRHSPGTKDGERTYDAIYNDLYNGGSRTLFNIFYVDRPKIYGQRAAGPDEAHTHVAAFADGGDYVALRGEELADMYRGIWKGRREIERWTRELVYLRPQTFILHDRTRIRDADPDHPADQWMAFHLAAPPVAVTTTALFTRRFEVGRGDHHDGTVTTLLPRGHQVRVTDLFKLGKVARLEVRPGTPGPSQRWLTVLEAAAGRGQAAQATRLSAQDGNVLEGELEGVVLESKQGTYQAVLFAANDDPTKAPSGALRYRVPTGVVGHLLCGLPAGMSYALTMRNISGPSSEAQQEVELRPAQDGVKVSSQGYLRLPVPGAAR